MNNITLQDTYLFFDSIVSLFASIVSLLYFLRWRNGKAWVSLSSFAIFMWLGIFHGLAFFEVVDRSTYGPMFIRPVLHVAYFMVAAHVIYDWKRNIKHEKDIFNLLVRKG